MSLSKILAMLLLTTTCYVCSPTTDPCCNLKDPVMNLKQFNKDLFQQIQDQYKDKPDSFPNIHLTKEQLKLKRNLPSTCVTCTARVEGGDPNL